MESTVISNMVINLLAVVIMAVVGWVVSLIKKNVTLADSLWGIGFVLIAWINFFGADGFWLRKLLLLILVTLWGLRLSIHLTWRNWGRGEDPRYRKWREDRKDDFWIVSLFKVFLLQALFIWTIALGYQYAQLSAIPGRFTWLDGIGTGIWIAGFLFESIGDWQLARFIKTPGNENKVMNKGLWAYTRHPNYFGECLMWWAIFFIALSTPKSFWTIISPLVISAVLLKMTGIPLTEKAIVDRLPEYENYIQNTNAFFPWFPKKK